jgi:hypothetical protein
MVGWTVKTNSEAAAGSTVTVGFCPNVTEPTIAVMVFVPASVELKVPIICPSPPVVPEGVRVLPVPVADRVTVAPLTGFPKSSSTVTVIVDRLAPLLAVIGLGDALTVERLALGGPERFTVCGSAGEVLDANVPLPA